ncbi:MAG: SpoIID/LytB domain-containing protein [Cyanobacteria bacterium SZAS LIN-3]|nr:SpoIID/LytB domain-containing protein [Cyanobacteria bacterium SZAS LIN-3]
MSISAGGPSAAGLATVVATNLKFRPTRAGVMVESMSHSEEVPDPAMPIYVKAARSIRVQSLHRAGGEAHPHYPGDLRIERLGKYLRLSARMTLDQYLRGVLTSEMPASYHHEALNCQALAARTYALNPRISHTPDHVNVCDSYLCCQYFAGLGGEIDPRIEKAIDSTSSQIIVFNDKPILALFSSNAGGHTESYQNCFSDPVTGRFPPEPISYLIGQPEGAYPGLKARVGSEEFLRYLFAAKKANNTGVCADLFSNKFAWSVNLSAAQLEAHLHHVLETLAHNSDTAPFVVPPARGKFGHIQGFEVVKRGVSGVAIELKIKTSSGDWLVKKELVIRKAFANPEARIARLNSARVFFDQSQDKLGLLSTVTVHGLGFGHGVGLQQTGAQGFANLGRNYREIIAHYFPGTAVATV